MARLIDAMKTVTNLSGRITPLIKMGENPMRVYQEVLQVISEATTADAVKVVRCRECKYHEDTSVTEYEHCCLISKTVRYNDFCSYGERREGAVNG